MLLKDFFRIFRSSDRLRFLLLAFLLVLTGLLEIATLGAIPLYLARLFSPGQIPHHVQSLLAFLGAEPAQFALRGGVVLLLLFLFRTLWMLFTIHAQARILGNRQIALTGHLYHLYLYQPLLRLKKLRSGSLLDSVFHEVNELIYEVLQPAVIALRDVIMALFILAMLFYQIPLLSLVVFLSLIFCAGVILLFYRRAIRRRSEEKFTAQRNFTCGAVEGFRMLVAARIAGVRYLFEEQNHRAIEQYSNAQRYFQQTNHFLWPLMEFVTVLVLLGILVGLLASGRQLQNILPELSLVAICLARLKGILTETMVQISNLRYHHALLHTMAVELNELEQNVEKEEEKPVQEGTPLSGEIVIEDVSFTYPGNNRPTLSHFSMRIAPGEAVAIVGPTGSGKSTLAFLLLGLYRPDSGRITVGGKDIFQNLPSWHKSIGFVPQELTLLDGTVRDNVLFGGKREDDLSLKTALQQAQLAADVALMPKGVDSPVGENGALLSGGQRQRLVIARELHGNPSFLILDEATSALDMETENALAQVLRAQKGTRTLLVIAHRQSTIDICDRIVKIE